MRVVALDEDNRAAWDAYAGAAAAAWLPHRSAWSLEVAAALGHRCLSTMAIDDAGRVRGVLPMALRTSRLFGRSIVSAPGASWAGAIADDGETAALLAAELLRLAGLHRADFVEVRGGAPLAGDFARREGFLRFPIDLAGLTEAPEPDKQSKRRLKRAASAGVRTTLETGQLDSFYRVYLDAMARLGSPPFGRDFFGALEASFPEAIRVLLVWDGDRTIATDLLGFWNGMGSSLFAGATALGRELAADVVAVQAGIAEAVRRECRVFDLGRSPAGSGGQTFKEHWPVVPAPLEYWQAGLGGHSVPEFNAEAWHWKAARAAWRWLPAAVQASAGPPIARFLL